MTKSELQVRKREIQDRMAELNDAAYNEKREFTEEEQREWNALTREKTMNLDQLREMATDAELAKPTFQTKRPCSAVRMSIVTSCTATSMPG